jgi:hypothetical protein
MEKDKVGKSEGLGLAFGSLVVVSLLSIIYAFHRTAATAVKRKASPEEQNAMQMKEQLEQLERIISEKESAIAALTKPN